MSRTILSISGALLAVAVLLVIAMQLWRMKDRRADEDRWLQLQATAPVDRKLFDPEMVRDLPDAARRYFRFAIAPGTPLTPVSVIRMHGEIGLGTQADPKYMPMTARQILAPPHGFIWRVDAGSGVMRMSGSDGMVKDDSWTRFWIDWTVPLVRAGGDEHHLRSSLGRVVAEAAIWAPASLLPENGVRWEAGDTPRRVRATVRHASFTQTLELEVADDGRPLWVKIARWSNVNPEGEWRLQPFGGTLAEFRRFGGFMLPARVEGGNHFGTTDYFPFFRVRVDDIAFY